MKKDLIERIKSQLKSLFTQKFAEVKAGELIISTPDEKLEVGSEVFMIDAEGMNVPLTDGEYTLDSGEKIEVVGGKVVEMSIGEVEAPESEVAEVKEPVVEEQMEDVKVEGACPLTEKVEQMALEIENLKKMYEEMKVEKEKMKQDFSKIAEMPSTKSIEVKPNEFKSVDDKKTSIERINLETIVSKGKKKVRG